MRYDRIANTVDTVDLTKTRRLSVLDRGRNNRYDTSTRDLAYQLWAFRHGRNAEKVVTELQDSCPQLDGRTVRRWAVEGEWAARADREIRELAPAIHESNVASLIAGSPEAVQALREVARGDFPAAAAGWATARVKAAEAILQRTGYPATVKVDLPNTASAAEQIDYASLSTDELIERQRKMLVRGT